MQCGGGGANRWEQRGGKSLVVSRGESSNGAPDGPVFGLDGSNFARDQGQVGTIQKRELADSCQIRRSMSRFECLLRSDEEFKIGKGCFSKGEAEGIG